MGCIYKYLLQFGLAGGTVEPSEDQSLTRMCPVAKKVLPEEGRKSCVLQWPLLINGTTATISARFWLHIWLSRSHPAMLCFTVTGNCDQILMMTGW